MLSDVLERERLRRELQVRAERLAQRLPESARDTSKDPGTDLGQFAEITEMAILVTDVRNSSGHIWSVPPREYFARINERLQAQASLVRKHRGSVLKFMGDGLIATFSGAGRHHVAVRCAEALCEQDAALSDANVLRCGIGGAEGVVVTGYMGEPGHLHYDIIGSTVHLASRLCGLASPGEAMLTKELYASGRYAVDDAAEVGELNGTAAGNVPLGSVWLLPPTLTAQYHLRPANKVDFYVGAGINYTHMFSIGKPSAGPVTAITYGDSFGPALQVGGDYDLSGPWFLNLDLKKVWIKSDVRINGGAINAKVHLDPWIVGTGIGYRF